MIDTAAMTMQTDVSAGLAGHSRWLWMTHDFLGHVIIGTNIFVTNEFDLAVGRDESR
jgi:hypothetical protein